MGLHVTIPVRMGAVSIQLGDGYSERRARVSDFEAGAYRD